MRTSEKLVIEWLASPDTGSSSETLAFDFLGTTRHYCSCPSDPSDLGRCLRLIARVPEVRVCVDRLAPKNAKWAKAAKVWDAIALSLIDEVGIDWSKGSSAPKTYKLMKDAGL